MSEQYTLLLKSILASSIWDEDDTTRVVWITLLAMADLDGFVGASVGGVAAQARKTKEETAAALKKLESPDPESRTPDEEGRRIRKVPRGWQIINHRRLRDLLMHEREKASKREWWAKNGRGRSRSTPANSSTRIGIGVAVGRADQPGRSDPKDLTGQSPERPPGRPPAHLENSDRSFWPTVELWCGPEAEHVEFCQRNGLDLELERVGYVANRTANGYRCANFSADFLGWLAGSAKRARSNGHSAKAPGQVEHEERKRPETRVLKNRKRQPNDAPPVAASEALALATGALKRLAGER